MRVLSGNFLFVHSSSGEKEMVDQIIVSLIAIVMHVTDYKPTCVLLSVCLSALLRLHFLELFNVIYRIGQNISSL